MRRPWPVAAVFVGVAVLAGCGSADELPPAAEPAASPQLRERPAGRVVRVGANPEGLAADPRTGLVAVGLRNPDRLALVDGESGGVVRTVPLPESPRHLQLGGTGTVLIRAERANALVEVPLPDGRPRVVTPVGRFPQDAAAAVGGSLVAVVGVRARRIALYDVVAGRELGEATAGVGPTHVVAAGGLVYVADTEGDAILVYRLRPKFEFLDRANLPGAPYGLALDRRRGRLWVTLTERNEVIRYELTEHAPRRVASYPTVRQPNSVAVDDRTGRVYIASRTGSELQILGR